MGCHRSDNLQLQIGLTSHNHRLKESQTRKCDSQNTYLIPTQEEKCYITYQG